MNGVMLILICPLEKLKSKQRGKREGYRTGKRSPSVLHRFPSKPDHPLTRLDRGLLS